MNRPPARSISPAAKPFGIVKQHLEQMLGGELLVPLAHGERLGGLDETLGCGQYIFQNPFVYSSPAPAATSGRRQGALKRPSRQASRKMVMAAEVPPVNDQM